MPSRNDIRDMGMCALIGFVEGKAKNQQWGLNKLPTPVDALGWTGNFALALYVGSHFVKNKWLRSAAKAAGSVAAYQLGRRGSPFKAGSEFFAITGWSDDDVAGVIEQYNSGALSATGDGGIMPGAPAYSAEDAVFGEYGDG